MSAGALPGWPRARSLLLCCTCNCGRPMLTVCERPASKPGTALSNWNLTDQADWWLCNQLIAQERTSLVTWGWTVTARTVRCVWYGSLAVLDELLTRWTWIRAEPASIVECCQCTADCPVCRRQCNKTAQLYIMSVHSLLTATPSPWLARPYLRLAVFAGNKSLVNTLVNTRTVFLWWFVTCVMQYTAHCSDVHY